MTMVYEQGLTPCGGSSKVAVRITLWGAGRAIAGRDSVNGTLVQGACTVIADSAGYWEIDLVPNSRIVPENTTYKIERLTGCDPIVSYISVPSEGGPYEAFTIEDDPMNSITSSALSAHAGNLSLHGGGIEVDFAEITADVPVTGTATSAQQVAGLVVTIPDIPRPVYVNAYVYAKLASGTRTAQVALTTQWDGVPASQVFGFFALTVDLYPSVSTEVRLLRCFARIPPNTACTVATVASTTTTPWTMIVGGNALQRSSIRAVTA